MKIGNYKEVIIKDLKPYERNSRTHPTEQIEQIKKSIQEFGFTNPLLINERNEIIAGHGRLEALKQLNKVDFKDNPILKVPCIEVTGLNEAQYKALVIADNKITENAGWNFEILKDELQALELMNFDIDLLGFNEGELLEIGLENERDNNTGEDMPCDREYNNKEFSDDLNDRILFKVDMSIENFRALNEALNKINENYEIALMELINGNKK